MKLFPAYYPDTATRYHEGQSPFSSASKKIAGNQKQRAVLTFNDNGPYKRVKSMSLNINEIHDIPQDQSEKAEYYAVFRCTYSLGKGIKNRIKSYGCSWNTLLHGWICPLARQEEVLKAFQDANLHCQTQSVSLPQGFIPADPKIANRQARLEILEEQLHQDDSKLFEDICLYDITLRPEDFSETPSEYGKDAHRYRIEKDFHARWLAIQGKKRELEQAKQEISHLSADPGEKIFDAAAPLLTAEALIEEQFLFKKQRTLQYCADVFWKWDGAKYIELRTIAMRQIIYRFLSDAKKVGDAGHVESFKPNKSKVTQIIDALQAICYQGHNPSSGAIWLDAGMRPDPKYLISFQNGLLDVSSWLKNPAIALIQHTPLLLNVNALSFDFDSQAPEPKEWLNFLDTIWSTDAESQYTLQEWFGYLLICDTSLQKILLILGPTRSGKGTIGRLLRELLGHFNVVGPTLSSLGEEFGLQPLLNKMLATISDARLNERGNHCQIIERLLSISGEDPLTINRKFLSPITVQLPNRIMILTNELPSMQDASGALAKRYLVLTLQKSWYGNEDTTLLNRLRKELPGILQWALQGLARLQKRGKFFNRPQPLKPLRSSKQ